MRRIICVGNSLVPEDACGLRVLELLRQRKLPAGVEVLDGGLAGLDLLNQMDDARRVAFVDRVAGFTEPGRCVLLRAAEVAAQAGDYGDHSSGLSYLLRILPQVVPSPPAVAVIGIEGRGSEPDWHRAAALAVHWVTADCEDW